MTKIFLFILFGILLYHWLRPAKAAPRDRAETTRGTETMVQCAYCRLHIPQQESLLSDGKHYCSEEHRRLDQR